VDCLGILGKDSKAIFLVFYICQLSCSFTRFLNQAFAGPVDKLLRVLHVTPAYAAAPITNAVAMELLVFLLLAYFVAVRLTLSVESPTGFQHLAEMTHEFVADQGEQIIGHGYERFSAT
jgi:F-type H+-transporting ATPase subunit a